MDKNQDPKIEPNKVPLQLSVGIGKNFKDAETALKRAKKKKNNQLYNIEIEKNSLTKKQSTFESSIVDNKLNNKLVKSYKILSKKIKDPKLKSYLDNFLYDPKTKLLNRTGYIIETNSLRKKGLYNDRIIIFFDVDDLHITNKKLGYDLSDKFLNIIGKQLQKNIRTNREKKDLLRKLESAEMGHRRNDSAGDEFVIDLYSPNKDLDLGKFVAQRHLKKIYEKQQELFNKLDLNL